MKTKLAFALFATSLLAMPSQGSARVIRPRPNPYNRVAQSVANMVSNQRVQKLARAHKMNIVNVMWEDTGRYLGSSVGPNISDVTIEVDTGTRRFLMPVLRFPNFTDKTGDVDIDEFKIRVGNENKNGQLRTISLRQFLKNPARYMSLPNKGKIKGGSLLAKRDSKVLTSAQAAFLPIPKGGKAKFYPVIFNYQSYQKNPAVLTLLVTRQGTSMTIIDNTRDTVGGGGSWGQRLYFNAGGKRAPLTAERLKDVQAVGTTSNGDSATSLGKDSNLLMLIQIPLKVKRRKYDMVLDAETAPTSGYKSLKKSRRRGGESDVDVAVLGHGPAEGPFTELDGLTIERDARFPVRVTVQFYQATSNGIVTKQDIDRLYAQIQKVYAQADYVGSLVVPEDPRVERVTLWDDATVAPWNTSWWDFPGLVERYNRYGGFGINPWYGRRFVW